MLGLELLSCTSLFLLGHFYHTMYNRWLGKLSTDDAEPLQFLEIGFYKGKMARPNLSVCDCLYKSMNLRAVFLKITMMLTLGHGYDAYKAFLPRAETHSIEIACIEPGPREEGKWPWGNFPKQNKNYQHYLDTNQLYVLNFFDLVFLFIVLMIACPWLLEKALW